jgi:hypothetical protein
MKDKKHAHQTQDENVKETSGQLANADKPVQEFAISKALLQKLGHRPILQIDTTSDSKKRDKR